MSFYYNTVDNFSEQYIQEIKYSKLGLSIATYSFDSCTSDSSVHDKLTHPAFCHHHHSQIEFIYVCEGELLISLDEEVHHLKKGDTMVINPFEMHYGEWISNGLYNEYVCLTSSPQMLFAFKNTNLHKINDMFSNGERVFKNHLLSDSNAGKEASKLITGLYEYISKSGAVAECKTAATLYSLFALLLEKCQLENGDNKKATKHMEFIMNVTNYLNSNYTNPISTTDISKALFMTTSKFCNMFRLSFGMTFSNYLNKFRVIRASELYRDKKTALTEIASEVGYSDYNYFSKMFKKYIGQTPAKYFNKWNN